MCTCAGQREHQPELPCRLLLPRPRPRLARGESYTPLHPLTSPHTYHPLSLPSHPPLGGLSAERLRAAQALRRVPLWHLRRLYALSRHGRGGSARRFLDVSEAGKPGAYVQGKLDTTHARFIWKSTRVWVPRRGSWVSHHTLYIRLYSHFAPAQVHVAPGSEYGKALWAWACTEELYHVLT